MTRWIQGHRGVSISVSDTGTDRPPVIFVHGFAHDRHVWSGVADRLSDTIRPICIDLRGHGESGWSIDGHYKVDDYAADIVRVLDALEIRRAPIVAHSLGGNAATLATAAHPSRVSALILVDTGPSLSLAGMLQVTTGVSEALRSYASLAEYRNTLDITYPLADPISLDRLASTSLIRRMDSRYEPRLDPAVVGKPIDAEGIAQLEESLWAALARVRCPTLVVRGATSAMLPAPVADRMVDEVLHDARLHTVERAGHSIMLDAEAELSDLIHTFLPTPAQTTLPRPALHGSVAV